MSHSAQQTSKRVTLAQRAFRAGVALVILALGLGAFMFLEATKQEPAQRDASEDAPRVLYLPVRDVEIVRWWEGYGTARPIQESDIAAEVSGVVSERDERVDAGEWVRAGDVLVRLDAREYEERAARAEALIQSYEAQLQSLDIDQESLDEQIRLANESVDLVQWEIDQLVTAQSGGGASRVEIERLRIQLKNQESALEDLQSRRNQLPPRRAQIQAQLTSERAGERLARLDVERCEIRAPFDGLLQEVFVKVGERVSIGAPVARLVDIRKIEVPLKLPISAARTVRSGDPAELIAPGDGGLRWEGVTSRIAPEADPQTRTVTVYVEVEQDAAPGRPSGLIPGSFVTARVRSAESTDSIVVPRRSLRGDRVFLVNDDDRIDARDITIAHNVEASYSQLDAQETQWAVVADGLATGDRVVVSNIDELSPGMIVQGVALDRAPAAASGRAQGEQGDES